MCLLYTTQKHFASMFCISNKICMFSQKQRLFLSKNNQAKRMYLVAKPDIIDRRVDLFLCLMSKTG